MVTKRSHIPKNNLQLSAAGFLSMCDLLLPTGIKGLIHATTTCSNRFELDFVQKRIQNLVKHQDGSFCEDSKRLLVVIFAKSSILEV